MSLAVMPSSVRFLVSRALIAGLALSLAAANRAESEGSSPFELPVAGMAPGPIAGTYPLSGFDSVNLFSGNLSLHLPILSVGGRGEAGYTITLAADSLGWTAKGGCQGIVSPGSPNCVPFDIRPRPELGGGEVGYGPGRMEIRYASNNTDANWCKNPIPNPQERSYTRLVFKAPDGSEIVFRDANAVHSDGSPARGRPEMPLCETVDGYTRVAGFNRRTRWVSMDSISASYWNETDIHDCPDGGCRPTGMRLSGYLMFRDGRHYRIDEGLVSYIYDRNGNKVSFTYTTDGHVTKIVDSLNREIHVDYGVLDKDNKPHDAISYYGAQGDPNIPVPTDDPQSRQRVIKVYRYPLDQVLRSSASGDQGYPKVLTVAELFPRLTPVLFPHLVYNPARVGHVILPNGTFYKILYNPYGEIAQVDVPTGGSYHYDYEDNYPNDPYGDYRILGRSLAARRTYDDNGLRSTTTYAYQVHPNQTQVTVDEKDSQRALQRRTVHFFYGSPRSVPVVPSESDWSDGKEYKTQVFTAGGTLLRQTEQTWFQDRYPWYDHPLSGPLFGPLNGPVVTATKTTLDNGLVSQKTFGYDQYYFNLTDVFEYDFGPGAPGSLLRHRQTSYLTYSPIGDYVSSFPGTSPGSHVRNLPAEEKVFDGQGVLRSHTVHKYDEGGLLPRSNMSGASVTDPSLPQ